MEQKPITSKQLQQVSERFFRAHPDPGQPVLSIYLDLPSEARHERRRWQSTLNSGLNELRARFRDDRALAQLSNEVGTRLLHLNPAVRAHGLVCFASSDGWQWIENLYMDTGSRFGWGRFPMLQPLVSLVQAGPKTGVVVLAQDKARLMTWQQGWLSDETVLEADFDTGDWRRYAAGAVPTTPQQSSTHVDDFQDRIEEQVERFIRTLASQVTSLARDEGWDLILPVAPPRLAEALTSSLKAAYRDRLLPAGNVNLIRADSQSLAGHVESVVARWSATSQQQEAATALHLAMSRGQAAAGPADCLNLLAESRVEHLLFDARLKLTGYWREDGRYVLYPDPQQPLADADEEVLEWAIAACLASGAKVTPLVPEAADLLSGVGGMVATLRY